MLPLYSLGRKITYFRKVSYTINPRFLIDKLKLNSKFCKILTLSSGNSD
jgi:hypothetical protein